MKQIARKSLREQINAVNFMVGIFFMTSIRAVVNGALQLEVAQARVLGGRKRNLIGALNASDNRFGSTSTLLYDWLTFTPEDFLVVFPDSGLTLEQLKAISDTWDENGATGSDALVFPHVKALESMIIEGEKLTPHISVTEVTESQIKNGEFFTASGANQAENIRLALEEENNVMKTSSDADADYIVHPITGDRIFRFTRTEAKEDNPVDTLVTNKVTRKVFNSSVTATAAKNPSDVKIDMGKQETLVS